jgi:amino acid adenylation domain-containing protein
MATIDCISTSELPDLNLDSFNDEDLYLSVPTSKILTNLVPQSNSKAIDFDPFVDGEILLAAPATESQQEIWLGVQLSTAANLACILSQSLRFNGRLDVELLQTAFDLLVDRHESLRMTFSGDGTTILIAKKIDVRVPVIDLSALTGAARTEAIATYQQQAIGQPFDIQHGPLFRVQILKLAERQHLAIISIHHLVCDGWSLGVISTDLAKIYTALDRGNSPNLERPEYFSEYAFLERAKIGSADAIATEEYWLKKFTTLPPVIDLPTDYPRPPVRTFDSVSQSYTLTANLVDRIAQIGIKNGCSLMTTMLVAYEIWLYKITGQTDLTVGVPTSGQMATGRYNLVGHCVHFLPLRSQIDPESKFSDYLRARNRTILDDYERQDFTFGSLLKKLAIPRDASRVPLISAVFNIDLANTNTDVFGDLEVQTWMNRNAFATFELFLTATTQSNGQLELDCQYNPNLFSAATIRRRLSEFENLLAAIADAADRSIRQLSVLSPAQEQELLVSWNQTQTNYPQDKCIHQLFEECVAIDGEAIALKFNDVCITYSELNRRANQLAHHLIGMGIGIEDLVGIAIERSIESIVGILAILKAGGAYLPIDLTAPPARLSAILDDARVSILLTTTARLAQLPPHQSQVVCLDDWVEIATASATNPDRAMRSTNLAYVMYTSGSTGQPKGVCVPHCGVVRLVKSTDYVNFSPDRVFLQLAPLAFDAATFEVWGSLLNGAKLVLYPGDKPSLVELGQIIAREQITTLWLTAGLFHLIVDERLADLQPLQQLIAGGDVLSVPHVQKVLSTLTNCQLINGYGPTENTTFTCCYPISSIDPLATSIPIGRPIANTQVYLLDAHLQPVPIGIPGELYVGGAGLATGYLNRPELTREKFIPHPFVANERLYRTGDLARYLPDGNLEFLGRIDNQVKIRGFRIELGEIEAVLAQHPSVREVTVILREDRSGDKRLVAYVVPPPQHQPTERELRGFLESRLPDYLIPTAIVMMTALPLTSNGKIDRRALPVPEITRSEPEATLLAPRDELELQLTEIWEQVLGVQPIGIRDNFFELGGHSLIAVKLFAKIEQTWGQNLPLATLLQKQTIEELATVLRQEAWSAPWSSLVLIRAAREPDRSKPPLFCIHPVGGNVLEYYALANYLEPDQPVYGLQSQGLDGQPALHRVEEMASHYIQEIRTVQPQGPYFLTGYSFGGLVAYEMAQQLSAQGQQIALLGLLDSSAPNLPNLRPTFFQAVGVHLCNLWQLDSQERSSYITGRIDYRLKGNNQREFLAQSLYKREDLTPQLLTVLEANLDAGEEYVARFYPGKLTLLRCQVQDLEHHLHPEFGWQTLVESLEIHPIPGIHSSMLKEPRIQTLAVKLQDCLQRSQASI